MLTPLKIYKIRRENKLTGAWAITLPPEWTKANNCIPGDLIVVSTDSENPKRLVLDLQ